MLIVPLNALQASSALIGGVFSCYVLYPLDVVKTTQQRGSDKSALEILKELAQKDGLANIWCT